MSLRRRLPCIAVVVASLAACGQAPTLPAGQPDRTQTQRGTPVSVAEAPRFSGFIMGGGSVVEADSVSTTQSVQAECETAHRGGFIMGGGSLVEAPCEEP